MRRGVGARALSHKVHQSAQVGMPAPRAGFPQSSRLTGNMDQA